ncbi:MAG: D-alanine--D-alanine ligase [Micromonosporaceae bacterium]|jgi:D-alanine-D-alanine ligase|nr:D-alanine--D-alanine ligase [Micromonosporaceae bacterium]
MSRVAVVGGGRSGEHDVSLASAAAVADALAGRHDVVRLTIDREGTWRDHSGQPVGLAAAIEVLRTCDAVLPMLHGPHGEDGTLAALCDLAGVPHVGSPPRAGALAMDKWVTKLVAGAVGVATAPGQLLTRADVGAYAWRGPVVVKPVAAGSSQGVSLVDSAEQLPAALAAAFAYDDRVLVEEVVHGREIDVAVLGRPGGGRQVAPPLEILAEGIFDHRTKYDGSARFLVPAPLADTERTELERAAVAVYDALGCAGLARVDFFLTERGPVLNEVNTIPGFTEHSQVPKMFAAAGMAYADLLDLLVTDALAGSASR